MSPATPKEPAIGVIGGGAFGRGIALASARNGRDVVLFTRSAEREGFGDRVHATGDLADLSGVEVVFIAVPSQLIAEYARDVGPHLDGSHLLVHVSRGLSGSELRTLTQVLRELTPCRRVGALAGPLVASALAYGKPAGAIVGSRFSEVASSVRGALGSPTLRIYHTTDVLGVEIASAMVGLITLIAGYAQELGVGPSALGVVVTRGMAEAARVGVLLGAEERTFFGLAGVGDVVAAIAGDDRPELRLGRALARGASIEDATRDAGAHIEGVMIARRVADWAAKAGIEAPISAVVAEALEGRLSADAALGRLMARQVGTE